MKSKISFLKISFLSIFIFSSVVLPSYAQQTPIELNSLNNSIDQLISLLESLKNQLQASVKSSVVTLVRNEAPRRVACGGGGTVTVLNVPSGVDLNASYWCARGGGDWNSFVISIGDTDTVPGDANEATRRVACGGGVGTVTVLNVPSGVDLNASYWCARGGGDWNSLVISVQGIEYVALANNNSGTVVVGVSNSGVASSSFKHTPLPLLIQRPGSNGDQVLRLQNALIRLGFLNSGLAVGNYGPQTTDAVRRFQQANNLNADGVAGPITLNAINNLLMR